MEWADTTAGEDGGAWARREAAVEAFFVYEICAEVSPAAPPPAPRGGGAAPPPAAPAASDAGSA